MQKRKLGSGDLEVSAIGLGCMGLSVHYGSAEREDALALIAEAVELGVTLFDTAAAYGDNELVVGEALEGVRDRVVIATKFGMLKPLPGRDGSPEAARRSCERSLERLRTNVIDLFYLHRVDPNTPIEKSVEGMATLVQDGLVRHIGLSEASAETIRRAHAVHPIAAVQSEYSLWERGVEVDVLPTCEELGIGFVPFSPLGRAMLTGRLRDRSNLAPDDRRHAIPRFAEGNFEANLILVEKLRTIADRLGCAPGQVALAWLLRQGEQIVPIPGTKRNAYLRENVSAADIALSEDDANELSDIFAHGVAKGDRRPVSS